MTSRLGRLRTVLILAVGIALTALGVLAYATDALEDLELDTVDTRFSIRGRGPAAGRPRGGRDRRRHLRRARAPLAVPAPPARQGDRPDRGRQAEGDRLRRAVLRAERRTRTPTSRSPRRSGRQGEGRARHDRGQREGRGQVPRQPAGRARGGARRPLRQRPLPERPGRRDPAHVVLDRRAEDARRRDGRGRARANRSTRTGRRRGRRLDRLPRPAGHDRVGLVLARRARARSPKGFFRDKTCVVGPSAPSLQDIHPTSTSATS